MKKITFVNLCRMVARHVNGIEEVDFPKKVKLGNDYYVYDETVCDYYKECDFCRVSLSKTIAINYGLHQFVSAQIIEILPTCLRLNEVELNDLMTFMHLFKRQYPMSDDIRVGRIATKRYKLAEDGIKLEPACPTTYRIRLSSSGDKKMDFSIPDSMFTSMEGGTFYPIKDLIPDNLEGR